MVLKYLDHPALLDFRQKLFSLGKQTNKQWLTRLIKPSAGDLVLDVGCGTGRYAELFDCAYYGIDTNSEYISYAQKKHKGTFQVMNASRLQFSDKMFHHVFSVGLLHNMSDENVTKTLEEMKRVCIPGGTIVIIEAVYPTNKVNVVGYTLLRLDPGHFARRLDHLTGIVSKSFPQITHTLVKGFPYEAAILTCDRIG
jgi:ubiquinone/menaquinone biosynthesis C-methylase UbiE